MGKPSLLARTRTVLRHVRRWLVVVGVIQAGVKIGGELAARRLDSGDESSSSLRRVCTFGEVEVRPTSQSLSTLRFDLSFAGLELDLTQASPAPGGVDVTVTCALAGGNIRVPIGWRVASDVAGMGGVTVKDESERPRVDDPADADVRVHVRALFGGVTVSG